MENLLDADALAKELGVSRATVCRWIRKGMPVYQAYPHCRTWFELEKVLEWLHKPKGLIEVSRRRNVSLHPPPHASDDTISSPQ